MSIVRTLRFLANKPAVQLIDKRLTALDPLLRAGWACVSRTYVEHHNGRDWQCEEIVITEAGQEKLRKIEMRS